MKAIMVKYLPPTAVKGARMKAYAEGAKPVIEGYDYGTADERQAFELAQKLATLASWGKLHPVAGWTGKEWVFTFQNDGSTPTAYTRIAMAAELLKERYEEKEPLTRNYDLPLWQRESACGETYALSFLAGVLGVAIGHASNEVKKVVYSK